MTDSKSTKRSLAASIGCIALCVVMLIGTTFAWFTDTATTGVSKVTSGTLGIELVNEQGVNVEGQTLTWKTADNRAQEQILWEPGCTYELENVYVKNTGSLAVKYKIQITGIKGSDKLNEAIDWTISDGTEDVSLDTDLSLPVGTDKKQLSIKGTMKKDAGNEYQGLPIDGITITVVATQDTVESDSKDKNYDQDATYPAGSKVVSTTASGTVEKANEATEVSSTDDVVTVTIPKDTLKADDKVALTVDRTAMTTDSVTFDIDFKVNDETPKNLANPITATVNIGTGLNSVTVTHNGKEMTRSTSGKDQTYSYDGSTGVLTIVTSTFSPFKISYQTDPEVTVNGVGYVSFADALAVAKEGDTIKLVKDATVDRPYSVDNRLKLGAANVTIDLNGKTLSSPNYTVELWGENDVLKNGKVIAKDGGSYSIVAKGKNVTIDSVTSIGGISVSAYNGNDIMSGISATITNCHITSGPKYYVVCSQGSASTYIENSTLVGQGSATFWIEGAATDRAASSLEYKNVTFEGTTTLYQTDSNGIAPIEIK